jgi:hypothetical protein
MRDFIDKTVGFMRQGVHLLIVDLFPPSPRDPFGIHKAIWDEIHEEDFAIPEGKDRIVASYEMGGERVAYVEPVAVGDALPTMPLFLTTGVHIRVPLEATYQSTWEASPEELRLAVESGVLPEAEGDD